MRIKFDWKFWIKGLLVLLFCIGLLMCTSCEKSEELISEQVGTAVEFKSTAYIGENGGETTFSKGIVMPKTGKVAEDGLFISQYPLAEYRYEYSITFDSVPTYTINEVTLDTISTSWEVFEVSRENVGFTKGVIWLPLDFKMENELYIGIDPVYLPTTDIEISIDIEGGYGGQEDNFIFALCTSNGYCVTENGINIPLTENDYSITEGIPVFDESGFLVELRSGFVINDFLIRFINATYLEETKSFTLNVATSNGSTLSKQFDIKFVPLDVYENRQCWLQSKVECLNLFIE